MHTRTFHAFWSQLCSNWICSCHIPSSGIISPHLSLKKQLFCFLFLPPKLFRFVVFDELEKLTVKHVNKIQPVPFWYLQVWHSGNWVVWQVSYCGVATEQWLSGFLLIPTADWWGCAVPLFLHLTLRTRKHKGIRNKTVVARWPHTVQRKKVNNDNSDKQTFPYMSHQCGKETRCKIEQTVSKLFGKNFINS